MLLAADLSPLSTPRQPAHGVPLLHRRAEGSQQPDGDARAVGFDGQRTGIAAWLADPAPMGSLDYVSPEATFVTAFVVKSPAAIVDELLGTDRRSADAAREALARRAAADRHRCAQRPGRQPGRRVLALARRPLPGAFVEAGDRGLRSGRVQARCRRSWTRTTRTPQEGRQAAADRAGDVEGRTYYMIAGGRSESAHGSALHVRRRLPDRRTDARAGVAGPAGEDAGHVDHAFGAVPGAGAARSLRQLLGGDLSEPRAPRWRRWPACSAHSFRSADSGPARIR